MQLLNGTLRCLQLLRNKLNVQGVISKNAPICNSLLHQHRHYSSASAVAISTEQFDGPSTDASKSPLITFHGLFGSKQNWRSVSKALAGKTNRRVSTFDAASDPVNYSFFYYNAFSDLYGRSTQSWRQPACQHPRLGWNDCGHTWVHAVQINTQNLSDGPQHGWSFRDALCPDLCRYYGEKKLSCFTGFSFSLQPELVERLIVVDISPVSLPGSLDYFRGILTEMQGVSLPATASLSEGRKQAREKLLDVAGADSVDFIMLNLRKRPQTGE